MESVPPKKRMHPLAKSADGTGREDFKGRFSGRIREATGGADGAYWPFRPYNVDVDRKSVPCRLVRGMFSATMGSSNDDDWHY
jgi:hypothetical protein